MPAESPTVFPCGVCRELIEINFQTHFDSDLEQYVCRPCSYNLRGAHAWLKKYRMPRCIKIEEGNQAA